jgi:2-dehydropantoate 2-reductase
MDRILIAGAGAIGSVVGASLHAAGHRVTLLGRRSHLDAIARGGLHVTGLLGERVARGLALAQSSAQLEGRFDLILCAVKSYDTAAMARALDGRLADGGVVVSLQNGLGNIETLAERFSPRCVLGARVIFGAEVTAPGAVNVTVFADPIAIGPAPALHGALSGDLEERATEIAARLDFAGVPAVACADIMPVIWAKLLYNAALNPLGALLNQSYGDLADDPDLRAIMNDTIDEAFAVARALGVALPFAGAQEYRDLFYGRLVPSTRGHRPTMLYDLNNRARTEIDALNGRIVAHAAALELDAPVNAMLVRMIHAVERRRAGEMGTSK